jgi:hypothetical protein
MNVFNDGDKVYDSKHLAWQIGTVKNNQHGQIQVKYPKHGFKLYVNGGKLDKQNAAHLQKAWYHKTKNLGLGYHTKGTYRFPKNDDTFTNEQDLTQDPKEVSVEALPHQSYLRF